MLSLRMAIIFIDIVINRVIIPNQNLIRVFFCFYKLLCNERLNTYVCNEQNGNIDTEIMVL